MSKEDDQQPHPSRERPWTWEGAFYGTRGGKTGTGNCATCSTSFLPGTQIGCLLLKHVACKELRKAGACSSPPRNLWDPPFVGVATVSTSTLSLSSVPQRARTTSYKSHQPGTGANVAVPVKYLLRTGWPEGCRVQRWTQMGTQMSVLCFPKVRSCLEHKLCETR